MKAFDRAMREKERGNLFASTQAIEEALSSEMDVRKKIALFHMLIEDYLAIISRGSSKPQEFLEAVEKKIDDAVSLCEEQGVFDDLKAFRGYKCYLVVFKDLPASKVKASIIEAVEYIEGYLRQAENAIAKQFLAVLYWRLSRYRSIEEEKKGGLAKSKTILKELVSSDVSDSVMASTYYLLATVTQDVSYYESGEKKESLLKESIEYAKKSLKFSEKTNRPDMSGWAHSSLGIALLHLSYLELDQESKKRLVEKMMDHCNRGVELFREVEDHNGMGVCLMNLGVAMKRMYWFTGEDIERKKLALKYQELEQRATEHYRYISDKVTRGWGSSNLAAANVMVSWHTDDKLELLEMALKDVGRGIEAFKFTKDMKGLGWSHYQAGRTCVELSKLARNEKWMRKSLGYLDKAVEYQQVTGDGNQLADSLALRAQVLSALNEVGLAIKDFENAAREYYDFGWWRNAGECFLDAGKLLLSKSRYPESEKSFSQAGDCFSKGFGEERGLKTILYEYMAFVEVLGEIAKAKQRHEDHDHDAAFKAYDKAAKILCALETLGIECRLYKIRSRMERMELSWETKKWMQFEEHRGYVSENIREVYKDADEKCPEHEYYCVIKRNSETLLAHCSIQGLMKKALFMAQDNDFLGCTEVLLEISNGYEKTCFNGPPGFVEFYKGIYYLSSAMAKNEPALDSGLTGNCLKYFEIAKENNEISGVIEEVSGRIKKSKIGKEDILYLIQESFFTSDLDPLIEIKLGPGYLGEEPDLLAEAFLEFKENNAHAKVRVQNPSSEHPLTILRIEGGGIDKPVLVEANMTKEITVTIDSPYPKLVYRSEKGEGTKTLELAPVEAKIISGMYENQEKILGELSQIREEQMRQALMDLDEKAILEELKKEMKPGVEAEIALDLYFFKIGKKYKVSVSEITGFLNKKSTSLSKVLGKKKSRDVEKSLREREAARHYSSNVSPFLHTKK